MSSRQPYDRLPGESRQAYAAFRLFLDAGPTRRVIEVAEQSKKSPSLMYRWSSQWRWIVRAEEYDREQDRLHVEAMAVARRESAERHARLAGAVLGKVVTRLQSIDADRLSPRDLIVWLEVAVKIERLALGEPERHAHEVSGPDGGPIDVEHHMGEADLLQELALIERELRSRTTPGPLVALPGGQA